MSVKIISGVPGMGKTLLTTILQDKHYEKENKKIRRLFNRYKINYINLKIRFINIFRKLFKKKLYSLKYNYFSMPLKIKINNVYANYPVLLDFKNNIRSNKCSLYDLNNTYRFLPYATIVIDEIQLSVDSDEYADKVASQRFRSIARFMQSHRHYGIKDIYVVSQHPSRVMKKVRDVAEEFVKITHFIRIPIIHIGIITMTSYFNFDDYGKSTKIDKDLINFDYKKRFMLFKYKKYYKKYDTCYLRALNIDKPLYENGMFSSNNMTCDDIEDIFYRY